MKKILLVLTTLAFFGTTYAQDTSFEADEGYQLGEINGQNGWGAFSFLSDLFTISDEQSSDGAYALRLGIDEAGLIPDGTTAGATRDISEEIPDSPDSYEVSADLYITSNENSEGEIDFNIYGASGTEALPGATIGLLNGRVLVIELSDFSTGADIEVPSDTFINLTMQFDFVNDETLYYVDDELVYTGDLNLSEITGYGFLSTGKTVGFVDNITTVTNPILGVPEFEKNTFSHYSDENRLYLQSSSEMKTVEIYNLNGQQVLSGSLNSTEGDLQIGNLKSGVYLARLVFEGHSKTFKFIRKD